MANKCLMGEMTIARQPFMCDDIIMHLLDGLVLEYDSLVFAVTYCDKSLILEEVYSMFPTFVTPCNN